MMRPHFLTLPNEILLMIIFLTVPYSIEHISLACKSLYRLSENARRVHQKLKQKYRHLDISSPVKALDEDFDDLTAVDHLHNIELDPRLSWYPLSVSLWTGVDGSDQYDIEDVQRYSETLVRISEIIQEHAGFEHLISRLTISNSEEGSLLSKDEGSRYLAAIINEGEVDARLPTDLGNFDASSALLVTLLPNIQSLSFSHTQAPRLGNWLTKLVKNSAALGKYRSRACNHSPYRISRLSKLKSVSFGGDMFPQSHDFRLVWDFAALPSLRSIKGEMFSILKCTPQPWTAMPLSLSTLILTNSDVSITDLTTFLSAIENLCNFQYHQSGDVRDQIDWCSLCVALQRSAGHSLKILKLATENEFGLFGLRSIGSLRGLKKLTRLELDLSLLEDRSIRPLSGSFPQTLEVLRLGALAHIPASPREQQKAADDLVEGILENLPCLRRIDIVKRSEDDHPYALHLDSQGPFGVTLVNYDCFFDDGEGCRWWGDDVDDVTDEKETELDRSTVVHQAMSSISDSLVQSRTDQ